MLYIIIFQLHFNLIKNIFYEDWLFKKILPRNNFINFANLFLLFFSIFVFETSSTIWMIILLKTIYLSSSSSRRFDNIVKPLDDDFSDLKIRYRRVNTGTYHTVLWPLLRSLVSYQYHSKYSFFMKVYCSTFGPLTVYYTLSE